MRAIVRLLIIALLIAPATYAQKADDPIDFDKARALLQREGTIEAARELATGYARRAEACLELFPPSPARDCLLELPGFAVQRTA